MDNNTHSMADIELTGHKVNINMPIRSKNMHFTLKKEMNNDIPQIETFGEHIIKETSQPEKQVFFGFKKNKGQLRSGSTSKSLLMKDKKPTNITL